jgi:hypothetical protein
MTATPQGGRPIGLRNENARGSRNMARTKTCWRRRMARELGPALIGIGAVALITINPSQSALGIVVPGQVDTPARTCSTRVPAPPPPFTCAVGVPGPRTGKS